MSVGFVLVTTSVASAEDGRTLARALVDQRLAACVQMMPIESTYRWEGAIETAAEQLLLCKIRAADYAAVEAEIRARHSYDVPEIVAVAIVTGTPSYLAWLEASTAR